MADFEAIDVWRANARLPLLRRYASHVVYIKKEHYDLDLLPGQEAIADVYAQLRKDLPRSRFYMNGTRFTNIRAELPVCLWRYCTQSVMALPIELLLSSFAAVVAEHRTRSSMRIEASTKTVVVTKQLEVRMTSDESCPVTITVCASVDDANVVVSFEFV